MEISDKGLDFETRHEGFVSQAYQDVVGVWTIGSGFTNGSKIAVEMLGPIRKGLVITREMSDRVLRETNIREYGPPVARALPDATQALFDAGSDYSFNCGTGSVSDRWFETAKAGNIVEAAKILLTSRTTAKGKHFAALERRRQEEATLILTGSYGEVWTSRSTQSSAPPTNGPDEELRGLQQSLNDLGYRCKADGWHGPLTTAAVSAFQKSHPNLKADGILGPATKSAIQRAIKAQKEASTGATAGSGAIVAGGAVIAAGGPTWLPYITIGGAIILIIIAGVIVWRWRDEIIHKLKG